MLRTLWLPSWYPSKQSPQNGDFVQRHARCVAGFANVHIIYISSAEEKNIKHSSPDITYKCDGNLTEEIVLYKKKNTILPKAISFIHYCRLYKKYIRKYIRENGLPDVVHVHVSMRAGLFALWLKYKYRIPYVVTEHWTLFTSEREDNFTGKNFLFRFLTRKIFKKAAAISPVSQSLGENIRRMVVKRNFVKIPNVVDTDLFYYQEKERNGLFTFIHVSGMSEIKNPKGIIDTFATLAATYRDIQLKMIGNVTPELKDYASQKCSPNTKIAFTGVVPYERVAEEMRNADAFVLFSKAENLPCVIAESLCCGVPVIATDVGGISEMVTDKSGILVSPNDEDALLAAMRKLLGNYDNYNKSQIAADAQKQYNPDAIGRQIINVYKKILSADYLFYK